jgi:hypothetical protein
MGLILLESAFIFCTFAIANKLRWRVKAAAQHSSSELGSAFALHFTCTCNEAIAARREGPVLKR